MLRLVLAIVALACQVGAGGSLPAADNAGGSDTTRLSAVSILCESGQKKTGPDGPSPHRHVVDEAIVSLAASDLHAPALVGRAPCVSAPAVGCIGAASMPPGARAPPARYVSASFARGPPNLV